MAVDERSRDYSSNIDAFSGEGVQYLKDYDPSPMAGTGDVMLDEGQAGLFTVGSSPRAISVSAAREREGGMGFNHFVFIELSDDKLKKLEDRTIGLSLKMGTGAAILLISTSM